MKPFIWFRSANSTTSPYIVLGQHIPAILLLLAVDWPWYFILIDLVAAQHGDLGLILSQYGIPRKWLVIVHGS